MYFYMYFNLRKINDLTTVFIYISLWFVVIRFKMQTINGVSDILTFSFSCWIILFAQLQFRKFKIFIIFAQEYSGKNCIVSALAKMPRHVAKQKSLYDWDFEIGDEK